MVTTIAPTMTGSRVDLGNSLQKITRIDLTPTTSSQIPLLISPSFVWKKAKGKGFRVAVLTAYVAVSRGSSWSKLLFLKIGFRLLVKWGLAQVYSAIMERRVIYEVRFSPSRILCWFLVVQYVCGQRHCDDVGLPLGAATSRAGLSQRSG